MMIHNDEVKPYVNLI